jgi:hypothetical protein
VVRTAAWTARSTSSTGAIRRASLPVSKSASSAFLPCAQTVPSCQQPRITRCSPQRRRIASSLEVLLSFPLLSQDSSGVCFLGRTMFVANPAGARLRLFGTTLSAVVDVSEAFSCTELFGNGPEARLLAHRCRQAESTCSWFSERSSVLTALMCRMGLWACSGA